MRMTFGRSIAIVALILAPAAARSQSDAALPTGGTISIESVVGSGGAGVPDVVTNAVASAMTDRGFTVIPGVGHAAIGADLRWSREQAGLGALKGSGGGATPSLGAGAGLMVPLGNGGAHATPLERTRLEIRIHRRGETAVAWEGAAVTVREAGSARGSKESVAADLAGAILRSYPVRPGTVIAIP